MLLPEEWRHRQRKYQRVVTQCGIFEIYVKNIQAETVYAALHPKAKYIQHCIVNCRVTPIDIRLFFGEHVEVILPGHRVKLPTRSAKYRLPVVGWAASGFWISPDVPVAVWIVARAARLEKPRVLVRSMVEHQVKDDVDAALLCTRHQPVKIVHHAELGVDGTVIADIVAEINVRGRIDR